MKTQKVKNEVVSDEVKITANEPDVEGMEVMPEHQVQLSAMPVSFILSLLTSSRVPHLSQVKAIETIPVM
jgi:hypothetical protein